MVGWICIIAITLTTRTTHMECWLKAVGPTTAADLVAQSNNVFGSTNRSALRDVFHPSIQPIHQITYQQWKPANNNESKVVSLPSAHDGFLNLNSKMMIENEEAKREMQRGEGVKSRKQESKQGKKCTVRGGLVRRTLGLAG